MIMMILQIDGRHPIRLRPISVILQLYEPRHQFGCDSMVQEVKGTTSNCTMHGSRILGGHLGTEKVNSCERKED